MYFMNCAVLGKEFGGELDFLVFPGGALGLV